MHSTTRPYRPRLLNKDPERIGRPNRRPSFFKLMRYLPNPIHRSGHTLQRGLDLKSPGLEKRLRDVLRILVSPRPLPQTRGPYVLVRGQLVFLHNLFQRCHRRDNRPNRLRLAPIWISAALCHLYAWFLPVSGIRRKHFSLAYFWQKLGLWRIHAAMPISAQIPQQNPWARSSP